jgi:hypothetical protein
VLDSGVYTYNGHWLLLLDEFRRSYYIIQYLDLGIQQHPLESAAVLLHHSEVDGKPSRTNQVGQFSLLSVHFWIWHINISFEWKMALVFEIQSGHGDST